MSKNHLTTDPPNWLGLDDAALLAQCEVDIYKASGPGGQHRNKVSSAVRLRHKPSGITTHGDDSRSQHDNKRLALKRLQMQIALTVRRPVRPGAALPSVLAECLFVPGGKANLGKSTSRLAVGRKDTRFWPVAQFLLDILEDRAGKLSEAAGRLGIGSSNLVSQLKKDRHLFAAACQIRKRHELAPLK